MILPLADGTYLEIVEVLDHPPPTRRRSARPCGPAPPSAAAGSAGSSPSTTSRPSSSGSAARPRRQPAPPRRHRAALEADRRQRPDLRPAAAVLHPVGESPPSCTRAPAPTGDVLAGLPGDRRRPAAGQRVARRDRRGPAGGRQGRVGRPARHARHPRRAVPDAERAGPALSAHRATPAGARPSPNIWHHTATYEAREPRRRPRRPASRPRCAARRTGRGAPSSTSAAAPASTCPASPRRRLGDRRRAAPRPGRAGPAAYPAARPRHRAARAPRRRSRCPTRRSTWCTPLGLLLRPRLRARAGRARPGRTPRRHRVRDRQRRHPVDLRRLVPPRLPDGRPGAVERFWSTHGWTRTPVDIRWSFASARTWRPWCASSSTARPPTRSWPSTGGHRGRLRGQPLVAAVGRGSPSRSAEPRTASVGVSSTPGDSTTGGWPSRPSSAGPSRRRPPPAAGAPR